MAKTGARLIKERLRQTPAIFKLVQVSKRDLSMNNDSLI